MAISAYRINIALNLVSNASMTSRIITRELGIIEHSARRVSLLLGSLGIGYGIASGIREMANATSDYGHQLAILRSVIRDNKQMADVVKQSWATTLTVPTTTASGNISSSVDMYQALGDVPEALKNLDVFQKIAAVADNAGKQGKDVVRDMARGLEAAGATTDPSRLVYEANEMGRVAEATNNMVSPEQYRQFFKRSGTFSKGFDEEFKYRYAPRFIGEQGGDSAGTSVATFENAVVNGRMTKAAESVWRKLGFLDAKVTSKEGAAGTLQLTGGKIHGWQEAASDPFKFVIDKVIPAMVKAGITDTKEQASIINSLFSARNGAKVGTDFLVSDKQYEKEARNIQNTEAPLDAYKRLSDTDPKMLRVELWAQLQDIMVGIGKDAMPHVIPFMVDLRDVLVSLNAALQGGGLAGLAERLGIIHKVPSTGNSLRDHLIGAGLLSPAGGASSYDLRLPSGGSADSRPIQVNVNVGDRRVSQTLFDQMGKQLDMGSSGSPNGFDSRRAPIPTDMPSH